MTRTEADRLKALARVGAQAMGHKLKRWDCHNMPNDDYTVCRHCDCSVAIWEGECDVWVGGTALTRRCRGRPQSELALVPVFKQTTDENY